MKTKAKANVLTLYSDQAAHAPPHAGPEHDKAAQGVRENTGPSGEKTHRPIKWTDAK
jgi:hypothetical protein